MKLEVRLYATLRRYAPDSPNGVITVEVPDGCTVGHLYACLTIPPEEVRLAMVNGISAETDQVLLPGNRIGLFPPVGGG